MDVPLRNTKETLALAGLEGNKEVKGLDIRYTTFTNPVYKVPAHLMEGVEGKVFLIKGILHQKIFYRLNLIFWIVMGCGIARFGRKGLKTTET